MGFSIRAFRDADRAALVALWTRVFPDDPPRNAPAAMIVGYEVEERVSMGRRLS